MDSVLGGAYNHDTNEDDTISRASTNYSQIASHDKYKKQNKSRSRSRSKEHHRRSSSKYNQDKKRGYKGTEKPNFMISSGPVMFEGTKGATLNKYTSQNQQQSLQQESQQITLKQQEDFEADKDQYKQQESGQHVPEFKKPLAKTPIGVPLRNVNTNNNNKSVRNQDANNNTMDDYSAFEWDNIQKQSETYWYDQDENAYMMEDREENIFVGDQNKYQLMEEQMEVANQQKLRLNAKQIDKNAEHNKWEFNRMIQSGIFKMQDLKKDMDEEDTTRVTLMVHDFKPPFLDGKIIYTKQIDPIKIVKDEKADMALLAKKGSQVIKAQRELKEHQKQREKLFQIAGTRLGDILKIQKQSGTEEGGVNETVVFTEDGDVDYKQASQYATAFLKKQEAVSDFARTKTLKQQREFLPIFSVRDDLIKLVQENKVVIIVGETGSGKTTQLTQYLYEDGYAQYGVIGCTQPRRVAAVSVAKRVSDEFGCTLGGKVGYSIRFEDCTSKETKIKYMTDGVLLRESLNDPDLEMYSCVVMDEAHERSLNTDVLFGILKKIAQKRCDLKVIITSATMNAERFSQFFGDAPIFHIPGRTFPVEVRFDKSPAEDYVYTAVKKAIEIHLQQPPGDILIFMTGQEDIEASCTLIAEKLETLENVPTMNILPIYSQLRSDEQARIFEKSPNRKCIIATNIAETSLTLDGVRYVIDTGYCKLKVYNPRIGMDALQVTPISQANADQRKGRAGRTGPGICYRLYSDSNYRTDMLENNIPEIQRTNLANVVLLLKSLNIDNLLEFDFMDPPPQETILNSMYQLWILGCLNELGELTDLGRKMAQFPLDPPLAKMLIQADELQCTEEILTIVSMLSVPSVFYRPKEREQESDAAREKLCVPESDHLTLLNVYEQWKKHDYNSEWCTEHFVQSKTLRKVREVRAQLKDIAKQQGLLINSCQYNYDVVRKAICAAYFTNAAKNKSIGEYFNMRTGMPCKVHPSSALFSLGYVPEHVVYHDLIMTTKEYMHCVTSVDPYWLEEMGPMFFTVKESFGISKDKSQAESKGIYIMEKRLQEAKKRQEELTLKKQEEEEQQKQINNAKAASVAQFGKPINFKKKKIISNDNQNANQSNVATKVIPTQNIIQYYEMEDY